MFPSRSNEFLTPGSGYNIGYQKNIEGRNGSSTWLRRMDQYENEFDFTNPDKNRLHEIKLGDGTTVTVYKKANGDIGLYNKDILSPEGFNNTVSNYNFNDKPFNTPPSDQTVTNPVQQQSQTVIAQPEGNGTGGTGGGSTGIPEGKREPFDWKAIGTGIQKIFGNPNLLGFGRLAGTLINNERIYDEALKGINPVLKQSYHTHRQVVGDEATKQAYYRRAAQGQTRAAQAFTSDADRQMAYQFEAKRVGDELRAQGDLADNQEIRRTSDESNQHQWANTQRDTEVANYNIAALHQADAARHNLLAQKHSAQWSSVDNYLQGIEYRRRQQQEQDKALADQIWQINKLDEIENDNILLDLKNQLEVASKKPENQTSFNGIPTINYNSSEIKGIQRKIKERQRQLQIEMLQQKRDKIYNVYSAKSGTKITRKKKDDLLYKTARDTVEHFRKMSKLSSDALNRKGPKIEKLADHPKGSRAKKYQYGGVAPFNIYKPIALGGETSVTSETSSGSGKSSSSGSSRGDDLIKKLFELLNVEGIPSDTNLMYAQVMSFLSERNAYGGMDNIDTSDIETLYVSILQRIGNIKFNKQQFDAAKKAVDDKNAGSEIAMDQYGRIAVQNVKDKSIKFVKPDEFNKSEDLIPLTNSDLLLQREINPNLAFDQTGILTIANNATGKAEIAKYIKENLPEMEKTVTEMYSTQDAKIIKDGLELLKDAPEGIYKIKNTNQIRQAEHALNYILEVLPPQMSKFLSVQAQLTGQDPKKMIVGLLSSNIQAQMEEGIEFDAVTGKASKKDETYGSVTASFNDLVQRGQIGVSREFSMITKDDKTKLYSLDSKYVSALPDVDSNMSIEQMLAKSKVGEILDSRLGITFGDQVINPQNLKDIMFDTGGGATFVTLPCKYENGHKVVNFAIKDEFDNAIKEVSKTVPVDWTNPNFTKQLAETLHDKGLDSLLTGNMQLDPDMLGLFMVVTAYTTDRVDFNRNSKYIEEVKSPTKALEQTMNNALSVKGSDGKVQDYGMDIDDWGLGSIPIIEGGYDNIYRANVFIPLNNDPISAQMGNKSLKLDDARQLAEDLQNYQKLLKAQNISSNQLYDETK